ncbi:Dabb family protein [Panacibacter ginsenosidivorans]|uniref:Dabb family protein n=1 Tax=Panacibacter ginsenosidivorans TaxID=1813871 RepID=A0A5B8VAQ0_9BACT|nr:Dabb family protein [Panacibacter ginsenosidivorans]QEC68205.1 Dabb family protein [Panacibacter ginsenosidivorans]
MQLKNIFIHHVFFWLKNPGSKEDLAALLAGLEKLSAVETIQQFHIGKPAATSREVIDGSYSFSWFLLFKNKADQDSYQVDPIHLNFVKECSHLWQKVVVYDTIDCQAEYSNDMRRSLF